MAITREEARERLEYLRGELEGECISGMELVELSDLAPFIEEGDVQLLEAAGIPEHIEDIECMAEYFAGKEGA